MVTTSKNAANTEGSTLWLTQGEKLNMSDLLYGKSCLFQVMMLQWQLLNIFRIGRKIAQLMTEKHMRLVPTILTLPILIVCQIQMTIPLLMIWHELRLMVIKTLYLQNLQYET